jgi:DNA-binding MarR family transcriptional regulator
VNEKTMAQLARAPAADAGVPMIYRILGAARELQTRLEGALDEIGLSSAKMGLLSALVKAGEPMPLSGLAECNKCVRSNVTQLVDRLEAEGLVRRIADPDDRRVTLAALTHEGRQAYARGARVIGLQEQDILRSLDRDEAAALVRVLEQLTQE